MESVGKSLVVAGVVLVVLGLAIWFLPFREKGGWLPGDISVERGPVKIFFPIVTCLALSAVGSLILWLFRR